MDTAARCRALGLALGAGTGFALTRTYLFDFAPVVLALCLSIGVLAGEAVSRRPLGERRAATLRTRRMRDYLPVRPFAVSLASTSALVVLSWWFPTPVHPDHQVIYFGTAAPVTLMATWATLATGAVLVLVSVWLVVRSPQTVSQAGGVAADEAWRRITVNHLADAYATLSATIFTAATFWYADAQMDWRGGGSPAWGFALSLLAGVGLAAVAHYAGSLMRPRHGIIDDQPVAVEAP
ncbi:hypothetical protein [Actinoplanes sp. NPDC020271]|uniref:hypothetical protein n=1 Tax=Actinoplanes sp. NPDC020271 TaxID=3363896 RepID=UPI0037A5C484